MRVRIRLGQGPRVRKKRPVDGVLALAVASLLTPAAVIAGMLALWRLGADMNFTSSFAITGGLFSHWQVWLGVALALELLAVVLNRYGHRRTGGPAQEI